MRCRKCNEKAVMDGLCKRHFIAYFESKVKHTIEKYKLANKKERVIVACSGGKDSTSVLYLMRKFGYNVNAFMIDLMIGSWSSRNLENLRKFCSHHNIKLHTISMRQKYGTSMCYIRDAVKKKNPRLSNCVICGVIKRFMLNRESRLLKADKIATGHNLNDEVSSIMMNLLKGNMQMSAGSGPMVGIVKDEKFIPRIKPLFFLCNKEIKKYAQLMKFHVLYERCPCSTNAFRREISTIIDKLEKKDPSIRKSIVKSFFRIAPKLRERYKTNERIMHCVKCGEPSRGLICNTCRMFGDAFS